MNITRFLILTIVIVINIQTGCSSDFKPEDKLDAQLRNRLSEMKQTNAELSLQCFVKFVGKFDEKKEKKIKENGVKVLNVMKEIVIIEGKDDAILNIASLDFVQSISLSQTRYSPD